MGAVAPKIFAKFGSCMQLGPYSDACFTPVHGLTGCGAFQRKDPVGDAAKGMPLNEAMPFEIAPATLPPVTSASRTCALAGAANQMLSAAKAANADGFLTDTSLFLVGLPAPPSYWIALAR